jgi:NAD(P)-dependent dehydrogenase (short-subunit alcohol dehydrogenase family)
MNDYSRKGGNRYGSISRPRCCGGGVAGSRRVHRIGQLFRRPGSGASVSSKDRDAGRRAVAIEADVSDASAGRQLFDTSETSFGGVGMLLNNAGAVSLDKTADTDDAAAFDRPIVKATFNTLREATTRLRTDGRIINLSSRSWGGNCVHPLCGD